MLILEQKSPKINPKNLSDWDQKWAFRIQPFFAWSEKSYFDTLRNRFILKFMQISLFYFLSSPVFVFFFVTDVRSSPLTPATRRFLSRRDVSIGDVSDDVMQRLPDFLKRRRRSFGRMTKADKDTCDALIWLVALTHDLADYVVSWNFKLTLHFPLKMSIKTWSKI